jgi:hypothetical protein
MSVIPHSTAISYHFTVMGSLRSFDIYKHLCAQPIMAWCVSSAATASSDKASGNLQLSAWPLGALRASAMVDSHRDSGLGLPMWWRSLIQRSRSWTHHQEEASTVGLRVQQIRRTGRATLHQNTKAEMHTNEERRHAQMRITHFTI